MKKTVYLIRHGEIEDALQGKFVGHTDVSLNRDGQLQMQRVGNVLKNVVGSLKNLDSLSIYSSPLKRAQESMHIALGEIPQINQAQLEWNKRTNRSHACYECLSEVHFGNWEGLSFDEIQERDGDRLKEWMGWNPEFEFPEGESIPQFLSRIQECVSLIHSSSDTVFLFTHGGIIRFLACALFRMPWAESHFFSIPRGSMLVWSSL